MSSESPLDVGDRQTKTRRGPFAIANRVTAHSTAATIHDFCRRLGCAGSTALEPSGAEAHH